MGCFRLRTQMTLPKGAGNGAKDGTLRAAAAANGGVGPGRLDGAGGDVEGEEGLARAGAGGEQGDQCRWGASRARAR